jgi:hypothetical protein
MSSQIISDSETRQKAAVLSKLSNDLRVYDSFSEILHKSKNSGYIDLLYEPIHKILALEADFIAERFLNRTGLPQAPAEPLRPSADGLHEPPHLPRQF